MSTLSTQRSPANPTVSRPSPITEPTLERNWLELLNFLRSNFEIDALPTHEQLLAIKRFAMNLVIFGETEDPKCSKSFEEAAKAFEELSLDRRNLIDVLKEFNSRPEGNFYISGKAIEVCENPKKKYNKKYRKPLINQPQPKTQNLERVWTGIGLGMVGLTFSAGVPGVLLQGEKFYLYSPYTRPENPRTEAISMVLLTTAGMSTGCLTGSLFRYLRRFEGNQNKRNMAGTLGCVIGAAVYGVGFSAGALYLMRRETPSEVSPQ